MIRKDILPDVWTDGWRCEAPQQRLDVRRGEELQLVLCHRDDVPMFMLHEGNGYRIMDDAEHMAIALGEGAHLRLYRLQGMNTPVRHLTQLDITMQRDAQLEMCTVTLGGGHVLVQDGAVKTEAYMTNRNILLTDKAHIDTRPFLEIYNDDVKCSHGSTIGQLDEQAMFYLQTRGISERTAVTMLSYAFCDEVIRGIAIESLRDAVGDMVKKRLHGELSPSCDECAIRCTTPCNGEVANFKIDPSKL